MARLIFQLADSLAPDNTQHVEISLEEPSVFGSSARPFDASRDDPAFAALAGAELPPEAIMAAGRKLYDALVTHPELAQYLATALQTQRPQRYPVFVEIASGSGIEALPWETLCSPNGEFLGLDERWAVGRIVDSPAAAVPYWQLRPPLRVASILSCLGVPAAEEWRALRDAVTSAAALGVEMLVVVSEETLYNEISAAMAAGGSPVVRVEFVPAELDALQAMVAEFRPHIIHFFCHGSATGSPHLQLAAKTDWLVGAPNDSLLVEAREIRDFTAPTDDPPWLVMLNCCESAAVSDRKDLQSLALRLVYDGGVPAVVGMREPVLSDDASVFTSAFYTRLVNDVAAMLDGAAAHGAIDWAQLVVEGRTRLAKKRKQLPLGQAAASTKEWTLPVVYVRPAPFAVHLVSGQPAPPPPVVRGLPKPPPPSQRAARLQIEALRGLLAQLPPGTPAELSQDIEARLAVLTEAMQGP